MDTSRSVTYELEDDEAVLYVGDRAYRVSRILNIPDEPGVIDDAMAEQPQRYAWWSMLLAESEAVERMCKEELGLCEAMIDQAIRAEAQEEAIDADFATRAAGSTATPAVRGRAATAARAPRLTEDAIKARVRQAPERQTAWNAYNEAMLVTTIVKSIVEAYRQRGQLLMSISANLREEYRQTSGLVPV